MSRNLLRRSGMLALVLVLALTGAVPAAALDLSGRDLGGWNTVWSWLADAFGWNGADGGSGGLTAAYENEGIGIDPNGQPTAAGTSCSLPGCEEGIGIDPNGLR